MEREGGNWLGVGGAGTGVYSGVSVLERVWVGEHGQGTTGIARS